MTTRCLGSFLAVLVAASCAPRAQVEPQPAGALQLPASPPPEQKPATPTPPPPAPVAPEAAPASPGPFEGAAFFLDPAYSAKVSRAAEAAPADAALLLKVAAYPTAIWLDTIAAVGAKVKPSLEAAAEQAKATGKPVAIVFVVYNLPNRDCSAKASAGQLAVDKGGEQRYRTEFIDEIAKQFSAYPDQRIIAIVEPDSLANLVTNLNVPKCAASNEVYRNSIAYAVTKLALPNVSLYLDAAHAGWMGWQGNPEKLAAVFQDVLARAGGAEKIRGAATNVSNYNTVSGQDGRKLGPANPCADEISYVRQLSKAMTSAGMPGKKFIIDTSRNGRVVRSTWGNWCNIKDAGIGPRPTVSPVALVDGYYWVKPPGESDGTSDPRSARFDENCRSSDALPGAPEAGQWFQAHFVSMAKNAEPPL